MSFLLSILIVYLHSVWSVKNQILTNFRTYFFNLQNICVPMFFFISGYLFFRNFSMDKLGYKCKKRIKSLVIPYLIWNIIAFIYSYLIMKILGANVDIPNSALGIVLSVINAEYSVLWFVKHLIIFTIFAPLIYFLFKDKKVGAVTLIFILILVMFSIQSGYLTIPLKLTSNSIWIYLYEGIYYFLGSYFSLNWKKECEMFNCKRSKICLAFIIFLLMFNVYITFHSVSVNTRIIFRLLFCINLFFCFDLLPDIEIKWWMKISFFIYCLHMYPLQLSQQLLIRLFLNNWVQLFSYLFMPVFSILLCILLAKILMNGFPKLWNIVTGGRGN